MLQGIIIYMITLPSFLVHGIEQVSGIHLLVVLGLSIWILGFIFEAVGDAQLDRFIHDPKNKGKLMTSGLWKYTRHPNYFGEMAMWWGIAMICLMLPSVYWIFVFLSPALITYLLLYVSGVPMLEGLMRKHPDWVEYERRTSVIIPLPPKK
jgi:steroid 5-alpha reductase family enzyme